MKLIRGCCKFVQIKSTILNQLKRYVTYLDTCFLLRSR